MRDQVITKRFLRLAFACALAALIMTCAFFALAHNTTARAVSFNPSQIYELTENDKESAEFSGKIEEELSELFQKGLN